MNEKHLYYQYTIRKTDRKHNIKSLCSYLDHNCSVLIGCFGQNDINNNLEIHTNHLYIRIVHFYSEKHGEVGTSGRVPRLVQKNSLKNLYSFWEEMCEQTIHFFPIQDRDKSQKKQK